MVLGLVLILLGAGFYFSDRMPLLQNLGRLPGDIQFGGRNWRVYFPFATSLLISVILSLVMWILSKWMRP